MSPLLPFALGIAASLSTYAGGVLAMRFKGPRELIFGLTGGFVIGLALLDLLPEALESGKGLYDATTIIGTLVAGLGLYLLLHRLPAGGAVGRLTLLLHSLMDGLGIGLAFQISSSTGWLVAAAVLAHDMADGANMIGMSMVAEDSQKAHRWLLANAAAPLVGVAIGQAIRVDVGAFALLLAVFAGGFLYIGASELIPRSHAVMGGWRGALSSLVGLVVMGGIVHLFH
ncbi:ZIP family metal transporter [Altererythrobacter sp. N1]|nr:ZIP family metal transporter [Altererythrobacter sp. N1]